MAIPISDIYVRLGEQNAVTEIKFVQGGWLSTGSLADIEAIDATRVHDKQIAYSTEEGKFYIATKVEASSTPPDFSTSPPTPPTSTPASLTWAVLPIGFPYTGSAGISGSLVVNGPVSASLFSGSFYGDGSNLTGIGSGILNMTGSFGSSSVDLDTTALTFTGSANGIIATVSASHVTFTLSEELSATGSFSGSFTGSFSGSVVAPGSNGYIIYNSGSYLHGTSSLFFDDVNHRVGLGTETPTTKLDIHGDALITGSLTVQGRVTAEEFHTEFVSASILYQSGSTKFGDTSDDVHSFSGSLRVTGSGDHYFTDGNVGIGTASPLNKLHIEGDLSIGQLARFKNNKSSSYTQIAINNDINTALVLGSMGSEATGTFFDNARYISATSGELVLKAGSPTDGNFKVLTGGQNVRMFISSSGNVGIGTTTTSEKLTVAGNVSASGDFYLDGALYDVNNEPGTTGQILSSTATGVDWVDPTGISVQAQQVFASVKNLSGGILYKGTPVHAVSGSSSGNVNPVIAASASDASTMPATFILNEDLNDEEEGLAIALGFIADVDTSAFEVGDVVYVGESGGYTNVKPSGSGNLIQNLGVVTKKHASNGAGYVYGSGRSNDVPNLPVGKIWVGSTAYSVTSSLVHLDEPNGRMGIGTDTPKRTLDVKLSGISGVDASFAGQMSVGEYQGIHFGYSEPGNNLYRKSAIVFERTDLTSNDAQGKIHILNGPQGSSQSATLADAKLTIVENGDVGIGTTAPSVLLHLSGSGGTFARVQDSGTDNAGLQLTNSQRNYLIYTSGSDLHFRDSSAAANRMIIEANGNVGIGTSTATAKLHVSTGATYESGSLQGSLLIEPTGVDFNGFGAGVILGAGRGGLDRGGAAIASVLDSSSDVDRAGLAFFYHNSLFADPRTEGMRLTADGRVGINTTTPSHDLHVNGTARSNFLVVGTGSLAPTYKGQFVGTVAMSALHVGADEKLPGYALALYHNNRQGYLQNTESEAIITFDSTSSFNGTSNIGINTIAPTAPLHVSGGIRFESYGSGNLLSNDIVYALGVDSSGNVLEIPQNTGANTDVDTGTEVVDSFASGSVRAAFTNYYVLSGSNMRAGQLMSIWDDSGNIEYTDVSTNSLGDTSGVLMFASTNAGNIEIKTTVDTDNWTVKVNTSLL